MAKRELKILKVLPVEAFKPSNPERGYEVLDVYAEHWKAAKIAALELYIKQQGPVLDKDEVSVKLEETKIRLLEEGVDVDNMSNEQLLGR